MGKGARNRAYRRLAVALVEKGATQSYSPTTVARALRRHGRMPLTGGHHGRLRERRVRFPVLRKKEG